MSGAQDLLLGNFAAAGGGGGGYQISRSLRFNSADTAYLSRTPASAGNRKTWTWSGWVKRSASDTFNTLFVGSNSGNSDTTYTAILFRSDQLQLSGYNTLWRRSTALYRDFSAWYHVVVALDTTQATASNRVKMYVNGSQITDFAVSNDLTQNTDYGVNQAASHTIGSVGTGELYNGYMAEINFIDGQALTPSSFGQTNATTGVWEPIAYTGTYGTNGFYLSFADNTSVTTLGYDDSVNSNNWTLNNFSVNPGVSNDSLVDTPTPYGTDTGAGGEVRGNYCVGNPLDMGTNATLANGNLQFSATGSQAWKLTRGTMSVPTTDKWYMEYTVTAVDNGENILIGFTSQKQTVEQYVGQAADGVGAQGNGDIWYNGNNASTSNTYGLNDVVMFAIDRTNQRVWVGKNGTWFNSGNPAAGTGFISSFSSSIPTTGDFFPTVSIYSSGCTVFGNFGQRPFGYTAPSGFKALVTQNLPAPTAVQGDDYFNTVLYTGNDGSNRAITGYDFAPDLIWLKCRSTAYNNRIVDIVNGVSSTLSSNLTNAAADASSEFISLNSNGFTVTQGSSFNFNVSGQTYVAWGWDSGSSNVTNTQGSITSTVRANTTSGFSIVTYTGTGSNATVGHGLGVAPSLILVKVKSTGDDWTVYHASLGATKALTLNTADAAYTNATRWNDTAPTSTVFSIGGAGSVNLNGGTFVAYCFAPIAGFSAFGSYVGNGSTNGPFIYTGFRPAFVMLKDSNSSTYWWMMKDAVRDPYNTTDKELYANRNDSEYTGSVYQLDFLSNGFKLKNSSAAYNTNGDVFVYMAFAANPFKYALAR